MNVLITGGTGFLGASLTKRLANHGESNIVLYEKHINEDRIEDLRDKATIVQGDVLDFDKLKSTLEQHKIDRIAHLAFLLTVASASNPTLATQINCTGTVNVFESAKQCGISRVVYASSVAVYGSRKTTSDQVLNETACAKPDTLYGAAKLYNDHMASIYTK
ncbi:NAD(P)-dependent oxidoreductase, partial [Dehalococcoidia bacterium]|nr:NAD(P)-dependent oxidoreductase [Dehalococcoidia bacterium]